MTQGALGVVVGEQSLGMLQHPEGSLSINRDEREAQIFGRQVQRAFDTLMGAIHAAREGPPVDLPRLHTQLLAELHAACVRLLGYRHAKTHALAVEFWNDWEAIFRVLEHPPWPTPTTPPSKPCATGSLPAAS